MRQSKELTERINAAIAEGERFDQLSDEAFAAGRVDAGRYYGHAAMRAYTRAENLAGDRLPAGKQHR